MNVNRINFQRFIDREVDCSAHIEKEGSLYKVSYTIDLPLPYKDSHMDRFNDFKESLIDRADIEFDSSVIEDISEAEVKIKHYINIDAKNNITTNVKTTLLVDYAGQTYEGEIPMYASEYEGLDKLLVLAEKQLNFKKLIESCEKEGIFKDGDLLEQLDEMLDKEDDEPEYSPYEEDDYELPF